jgi:hypothetical protein
MLMREHAREHPTVGVTDQHVRRLQAGGVNEPPQVGDRIARVAHATRGHALAEPGAVMGTGMCRLPELRLDIAPRRAVTGKARLEDDRRATGAHALQIQPTPATDRDETAPAHDRRRRLRAVLTGGRAVPRLVPAAADRER